MCRCICPSQSHKKPVPCITSYEMCECATDKTHVDRLTVFVFLNCPLFAYSPPVFADTSVRKTEWPSFTSVIRSFLFAVILQFLHLSWHSLLSSSASLTPTTIVISRGCDIILWFVTFLRIKMNRRNLRWNTAKRRMTCIGSSRGRERKRISECERNSGWVLYCKPIWLAVIHFIDAVWPVELLGMFQIFSI